jgi:hypothetical protein
MTLQADRYDAIKKNFPETLEKCMGNVTLACRNVGISRDTFYKWYKEDEAFKAKCSAIKETVIDFVESKLIERINEKDTTSIIFYLKTQGKGRGYVERIETTGKDGGAIKQEVDLQATKEQRDALVRILNDK